MSVIGPLDKKKAQGEDGGQLCSVVSKDDADASLHVMRPTGKDEWRKEDVANAIVEHYVPPNCVLATVPKPHGFQALHNKPNPNTKLDFFIEDQRVDLTSNLWSSHESEPSDVLEVLCQGYKVAELQVKALPKIGIGLEPKALDEQCGALIAMEGGRILNRSPLAFLEDGLCTKQNLKFTPQSLHQNLYSGSYATKKNYIYEKLKELCDEEPVPKSQVEALIKLNHTRMPVLEGSTPSKDYLWRALGFWSISLVQLHVAVKTEEMDAKKRLLKIEVGMASEQ